MAAKLKKITQGEIKTVRGKLGELRVTVDGTDVYTSSRLFYPGVGTIVDAVRSHLVG